MEHGLKYIAFYVQKHITPCTVVITSLLVRDKPPEAPAYVKRVYLVHWLTVAEYQISKKTENVAHDGHIQRQETMDKYYVCNIFKANDTKLC